MERRSLQTGIYEIVNTKSSKRYIGSAVRFEQRWAEHRSELMRGCHHNRHLQSSWLKHGIEAFEFRRLIVCEKRDLLLYEQIAIDALSPEFNVARIAGSSIGCIRTPETRAKIAAKALGRKRSRESIEKAAAKRRGVPLSEAQKAHLYGNTYALGSRHSPERRAAISEFMKGRPRPKSPEHRAKMSAALKGRKATPEARANQSAAQLGKKRGPYKTSRTKEPA